MVRNPLLNHFKTDPNAWGSLHFSLFQSRPCWFSFICLVANEMLQSWWIIRGMPLTGMGFGFVYTHQWSIKTVVFTFPACYIGCDSIWQMVYFKFFCFQKCIRFAQQLVQYGRRVRYSGLSDFCALNEFSARFAINWTGYAHFWIECKLPSASFLDILLYQIKHSPKRFLEMANLQLVEWCWCLGVGGKTCY